MNGPVDTKLEALPKDVEDLLDRERQAVVVVPLGAEQAVLAAVTATVAAAGAGAAGSSASASTASTAASTTGATGGTGAAAATGVVHAATAGKVASGLVLFMLGGLAGAGGHALYARQAMPAPAPIVEIAPPSLPAPLPVPPAVEPVAAAAPVEPAPVTPVPMVVAPAPPKALPRPLPVPAERTYDTALAAERGVLEVARMALARGQAESAIPELEKHARLFPKGQLAEEREALYVQALVFAGHYPEARAKGTQFQRLFPKSMLLPAVQETLKSIP